MTAAEHASGPASSLRRLGGWAWSCRLPFRVALGSAFWLGACVGLSALWGQLPIDTSDEVAMLILAGLAAATLGLGYFVGSWWALLVPAVCFVAMDVVVAWAAASDPGAAAVFWLIWVLFAPVVLLVWLGIALRRGRQRRSTAAAR